jgi:hypothetical protein
MTTSANIATAPGPFVSMSRLPYPYGGKVSVPAYKGRAFIVIKPTVSTILTK